MALLLLLLRLVLQNSVLVVANHVQIKQQSFALLVVANSKKKTSKKPSLKNKVKTTDIK